LGDMNCPSASRDFFLPVLVGENWKFHFTFSSTK
jgi:hypothetical protein